MKNVKKGFSRIRIDRHYTVVGKAIIIEIINRFLDGKDPLAFTEVNIEKHGYHKIEFYEIEPPTPKPFVACFSESMDMFYEARSDALNKFDAALARHDTQANPRS